MRAAQNDHDPSGCIENLHNCTWFPDLEDNSSLWLELVDPTGNFEWSSASLYSSESGNEFDTFVAGVAIDGLESPSVADPWLSSPVDSVSPDQLPSSALLYIPQSGISPAPQIPSSTTSDPSFSQAELPLVHRYDQPVHGPFVQPGIRKVSKHRPRKGRSTGCVGRSDTLTLDLNNTQDMSGVGQLFIHGQRRRSKLNEQDRDATAKTRRRGACGNCRRQKVRCGMPGNVFTPCDKCRQSPNSLLRYFCIRATLLDISFFRLGSTFDDELQNFTRRQSGPVGSVGLSFTSVSHQVRKIFITHGLEFPLGVTVSRFEPTPKDPQSYKWKDTQGNPRQFPMPPYYISDMAQAEYDMLSYFNSSYRAYIKSSLQGSSSIVLETFEFACTYTAPQSPLVLDALRIWAATRITEQPWEICGNDTLGVDRLDHPKTPWRNQVPVTPIMDTQLDDIVLNSILLPAQKRVLAELDRRLRNKSPHDWFEIYLFMFIMMSNFEFIFEDMIDYTSRHGIDGKPRGRPSLNESYIHACKTLLAYFHFAYNGSAPLAIDNDDVLNAEQRCYMKYLQRYIVQQQGEFDVLKNASMYGKKEMYWCHQVLTREWCADTRNDGSLLEFTEKDFITW